MATVAEARTESVHRWYALYVRPKHEKTTEQSLMGKGFAAFSPGYRVKRKCSDRTKELDLPLFPGYVFCQFDPEKRLPILTTPGVVNVVSAGTSPLPVEDREIHSIRTLVISGRPVHPWPYLQQGQAVRIQAGPLCGAEGTLVRTKGENRLIVSVTMLQRSVAVEIDHEWVTPVF